jgi:peptidoglycan/xylan/chitin deacetylase (PgdA/CDA1 family)
MRLRRLAGRALAATPLPGVMLRYRARRHVTVLGYHRVLPPVGLNYPFNEGVITATPEEFTRELRYLRENLDVISVPELLDGLRNPSLLPPRPAVITFDDGYVDNYTCAFPLLREARLTACFFLCTGLVGTRQIPWQEAWVCCLKQSRTKRIESPFGANDAPYDLDRESLPESVRRFKQHMVRVPWAEVPEYLARIRELTSVDPSAYLTDPLFMSWEAAREMDAAGMDIGGHTRHHPVVSALDAQALRDEVGGCHADLTSMLGRAAQVFAYPFGTADAMSEAADREIERAGFSICFSFIHGFSPRHAERTRRLPRIHAVFGDDTPSFRLRLATAPSPAA